jgi:hypothetical protein
MMPIVSAFGNWKKWMPTMLQHGAKAEALILRTVRCFAKRITEQKETDKIQTIWAKKTLAGRKPVQQRRFML